MSNDGFFDDASLIALDRGLDSFSHLVQFYEDDAFLVDTVSRLVGNSLAAGDGAVIIATGPHREAIEKQLLGRGLDLDAMCSRGRFLSLDASETLAKIMVDEYPDAGRFEEAGQPAGADRPALVRTAISEREELAADVEDADGSIRDFDDFAPTDRDLAKGGDDVLGHGDYEE